MIKIIKIIALLIFLNKASFFSNYKQKILFIYTHGEIKKNSNGNLL